MTLIHEIFATEDASRVLGMAMMASLGLGIGAIWEERNGSSHAVERLWGAIISGVFVMLAFIMAEQSGSRPSPDGRSWLERGGVACSIPRPRRGGAPGGFPLAFFLYWRLHRRRGPGDGMQRAVTSTPSHRN